MPRRSGVNRASIGSVKRIGFFKLKVIDNPRTRNPFVNRFGYRR